MKDPDFIIAMLQKGEAASQTAKEEFAQLSAAQLNWKPLPNTWSIGQCLDHLVISDSLYFPTLEQLAARQFRMNRWQQWSPFSSLFGRMLVTSMQEQPTKKLRSPKIFQPGDALVDTGIIPRFATHIDTLLAYIRQLGHEDLDRTRISSPVSGFITYSLRHALLILLQHEHRHLNQALRLRQNADFPA